jgi:hypothetical protein
MENCFVLFECLPLHVGTQNALWRRLQVFARSQWFFNGRLAYSGSDWPTIARRSQQRACSDCLALLYDSSDLCLSGCGNMLALIDLPWTPPWLRAMSGCRNACLDGLIEFGRRGLAGGGEV